MCHLASLSHAIHHTHSACELNHVVCVYLCVYLCASNMLQRELGHIVCSSEMRCVRQRERFNVLLPWCVLLLDVYNH